MSLIDFIADRRESSLTRWHARRTVQTENLAEHHGRTARTTLLLCRALRHHRIAEPDDLAAVEMAMLHDAAEVTTGDFPGRTKAEHPALKEALVEIEIEVIDNGLYVALPSGVAEQYRRAARRIADPGPDDLEAQIVGYCDKLEAHLFVQSELALGNTTMHDAANDTDASTRAALERLQWPWLQRLRQVTDLP